MTEQTENTPAREQIALNPGLPKQYLVGLVILLTLALIPGILLIRALALGVTQYQVSAFEDYTRTALAEKNFERAIELCTGALKAGVNRSDHWGKVYLLRAQAYAGLNKLDDSLGELEAATAFWRQKYYYATEENRVELASFGTELGRKLLAASAPDKALRAFSTAGMGSGDPGGYLADLIAKLDDAQKKQLWKEAPLIIVEDFREKNPPLLAAIENQQNRTVAASKIDPEASCTGGVSALLELGPSSQDGRARFGLAAYLPVSETPYALRAYLKEETPSDTQFLITYWFESAQKSALTLDAPAKTLDNGWKCFDIRRNFYQERLAEANQQGYLISGGIINNLGISLSPSPANRFWLDRIELYLP
ncbi:MAG TPA: hypothetical protein PLI09_03810 [Candidatus Hydrogenedentes bacterium]|mgnify:CR=1 FL=1|nr:hypothetical protein [Candidatus Hydrogenedentota bacterium]